MKKSVYSLTQYGSFTNFEGELLLDIERDLTEKEVQLISRFFGSLAETITEENFLRDPIEQEYIKEEKRLLLDLFSNREILAEECLNEYSNSYYFKHHPWFIVTTHRGRIKIGWRKRVIHIGWDDSLIVQTAEELFPAEDTTKVEKTIHAWSYDLAREYINVLLSTE